MWLVCVFALAAGIVLPRQLTALSVYVFNHFVQVLLGDLMPVWPQLDTYCEDPDKDLFHFVVVSDSLVHSLSGS